MKKFTKILAILLALGLVFSFAACNNTGDDTPDNGEEGTNTSVEGIAASDLKIGVILLHDESVGYDLAHMDGIKAGAAANGVSEDQIIWKKSTPEDAACADAARDLAGQGCNLIISDSYGHQDFMLEVAQEFEDITFVSMTGDKANYSEVPNYKNAFTSVFESRYVSGVVAGMKIKSLIDDGTLTVENYPEKFDAEGNVKLGYVGAFNYAEVVSGYTAFYLGAKSIVPNVVMEVEYTTSWADEVKEAASAESLIKKGCVIIGQHADTTGAPATIERYHNEGELCFSVGYNISMLEAAPTAALTSASNNWAVYYTYAIGCIINGEDVATDWAKGYAEDSVRITDLGPACAEGTAEKVEEVIAGIKDGSIKVFDTATFTCNGSYVEGTTADFQIDADGHVTACYGLDSDGDWVNDKGECIIDGAFIESSLRSAPYFALRIDGILENAMPEA